MTPFLHLQKLTISFSKTMKKLFILVILLLLNCTFIVSQETNSFSPEIKRIAVFKNGYAFTYREGVAKTQNGWAYTEKAPKGVLGTVWGYSTTPKVRVMQLLASPTTKHSNEKVQNINEILIANKGSRIRFESNKKVYSGTYDVIGNNTIALKTQSGTLFIPFSSIYNVEILGSAKLNRLNKETRLSLKVKGAKDGQDIKLGVAALERGIRWIPAYRVEVKGSPIKEAKLELEAMLINELTDLKNSEVNFVVGVPSFLYQNSISPLSMNTAFAGVSSYFRTGTRNRRDALSNAIMTQTLGASRPINDASPTIDGEEQLSSFSAEQLFLYKTEAMNLKKGERASLRLFSLTVPCSEVFEWKISDGAVRNRNQVYSSSQYSQLLSLNLASKIWYGLKLKNNTNMPWTTAPAIGFRDWKPLGQNMLTFTPRGVENILPITPATEVVGTHTLEEKSREQVQMKRGRSTYNYALVTVEGTIKVRNTKKEPVELVLKRQLIGDVISTSDNGTAVRDGLNLQAINPKSIIKWNLKLPSGKKEIRYTYKIYITQ